MVSSLGLNAATSCASVRAGLSNPFPLRHHVIVDIEDNEEIPLVGYPVFQVTDGFSALARWNIMAKLAIDDLMTQVALQNLDSGFFWSETGLMVVGPALNTGRFALSGYLDEDSFTDRYAASLRHDLSASIPAHAVFTQCEDHPSLIQAIDRIGPLLKQHRLKRMVLVAADSNIDPHSLWWLAKDDRLKTPDNPTGLIPGESAVALLIDPSPLRQHPPLAHLRGWGQAEEPGHLRSEAPNTGRGLTQAIRAALQMARLNEPLESLTYTDLNGEVWRATELGMARAGIPQTVWADGPVEVPAESLGDTGAAGPGIALTMFIQARLRGYAPAQTAMILASSEFGATGALIVGS